MEVVHEALKAITKYILESFQIKGELKVGL